MGLADHTHDTRVWGCAAGVNLQCIDAVQIAKEEDAAIGEDGDIAIDVEINLVDTNGLGALEAHRTGVDILAFGEVEVEEAFSNVCDTFASAEELISLQVVAADQRNILDNTVGAAALDGRAAGGLLDAQQAMGGFQAEVVQRLNIENEHIVLRGDIDIALWSAHIVDHQAEGLFALAINFAQADIARGGAGFQAVGSYF